MRHVSTMYLAFLHALLVLPRVSHAQNFADLENPLEVGNLTDLLTGMLAIVIVAAIPIVVIVLIYAGFLFVIARGNPQTVEQARLTLTYGLIGGVLIIASYAIVAIVENVVTNF